MNHEEARKGIENGTLIDARTNEGRKKAHDMKLDAYDGFHWLWFNHDGTMGVQIIGFEKKPSIVRRFLTWMKF